MFNLTSGITSKTNVSNITNTNMFESFTGALPIAPVKLSGKYKIVVDVNGNLFFDDYAERRIAIDKTQNIIPQILNFLQTPSGLNELNRLRYGGRSITKNLKSWHIPILLNNINTIPNYFVLNKVPNSTITVSNDLHRYSNVQSLINLEKVGLTKIFRELLSDNVNEFPVNYNLSENYVIIYGHSIPEKSRTTYQKSIIQNKSNQPYIDVFNNAIMNTFETNNIVWLRLLNIEFEFEYSNPVVNVNFDNFYGYLSKSVLIDDINSINYNLINLNIQNYPKKDVFSQIRNEDNIDTSTFNFTRKTLSFVNSYVANSSVTFDVTRLFIGDSITIKHPNNSVIFKYTVTQADWKLTMSETLELLVRKMTILSGKRFDFIMVNNNHMKIELNFIDSLSEEYFVDLVPKLTIIGSTNRFRHIGENDIVIPTLNNINNQIVKIKYNNNIYDVVEQFVIDGKLVFRLDRQFETNRVIGGNVELYETGYTEQFYFPTIPYYSLYSEFDIIEQYNANNYINELKELYTGNNNPDTGFVFDDIIEEYESANHNTEILPYYDVTTDSTKSKIQYQNHNIERILNMNFVSGCSSFIAPNILNMEQQFFENGGNPDVQLLDFENYKFNWFLIKSICPSYYLSDIRSLRYFTDSPKITSRLIKTSENSNFVECVFLGVKYRLPLLYQDFDFAVYLDPNGESSEIKYDFDVDIPGRKIYLRINLYIDFIDLIRGGDINNQPLIDLSLFYDIQKSYNLQSDVLFGFSNSGILLADYDIPVMFNNVEYNDWKVYDDNTGKWYICLKRNSIVNSNKFTDLFIEGASEYKFFVYSSITINGEVRQYPSVLFIMKNIVVVKDDYVWIEDLSFKFFDSYNLYLNKYGIGGDSDFIEIVKSDIILLEDQYYNDDFNARATIIQNNQNVYYKIFNHEKEYSIKEYYFELNRFITYPNNNQQIENGWFIFPDYHVPGETESSLRLKYEQNSLDESTDVQRITLFERNQVWHFIRELMFTELRFKNQTTKQVRNYVNQLLIARLQDYVDLKSIKIRNPNVGDSEFVRLSVVDIDTDVVIWRDTNNVPKVYRIKRHQGFYLPYFRYVNNESEFYKSSKHINDLNVIPTSIYNLYDRNFGGTDISATGLWQEVTGNIISSLYNKIADIKTSFNLNQSTLNSFDLVKLLKVLFDVNNIIITNRNEQYIANIDNNIDNYILESYSSWLLDFKYSLVSIENDRTKTIIPFEIDFSKNHTIKIKQENFQELINELVNENFPYTKLNFVFKIR